MRMSFDDEESFKEAVESLRFNSSDPNTPQQLESSNSMQLEDSERNEDHDNITPSDPITLQVRRVGSSSNLSMQEFRRSGPGDVQVSFDNPSLANNPSLEFTSSIGCSSIGRSQERSEDHANDTEKYLFPTTSSNFLS